MLGEIEGDALLASEGCAFDLLGAEPVRELQPGELVVVDREGVHAEQAVPPRDGGSLCIFEFIYLRGPTRTSAGSSSTAHASAWASAWLKSLRRRPTAAAIPDSGTPAAIGFAWASGIPFQEGLIKNRYVGRTFIQLDQGLREHGSA